MLEAGEDTFCRIALYTADNVAIYTVVNKLCFDLGILERPECLLPKPLISFLTVAGNGLKLWSNPQEHYILVHTNQPILVM